MVYSPSNIGTYECKILASEQFYFYIQILKHPYPFMSMFDNSPHYEGHEGKVSLFRMFKYITNNRNRETPV